VIGLLGWLLILPVLLVGAVLGLGALVIAALLGGTIFLVPLVPFVAAGIRDRLARALDRRATRRRPDMLTVLFFFARFSSA
jgi:hypothetical protein